MLKNTIKICLFTIFKILLLFISSSLGLFQFLLIKFIIFFTSNKKLDLLLKKYIKEWYYLYIFLDSDSGKINYFLPNDYKKYVQQKNKSYLFICNHPTECDWLFLWSLMDLFGDITFCNIILKEQMKYIPSFGWFIYFMNYIFLSRKNKNEDLEKIRTFVLNSKINDEPLCVLLFPEGTDFTTNKWKNNVNFAKKNFQIDWSNQKYTLFPRHAAFHELMKNNHFDYIIDLTIYYKNMNDFETTKPTIFQGLIKFFDFKLGYQKFVPNVFVRCFDLTYLDFSNENNSCQFLINDIFKKKNLLLKGLDENWEYMINAKPDYYLTFDQHSIIRNNTPFKKYIYYFFWILFSLVHYYLLPQFLYWFCMIFTFVLVFIDIKKYVSI